MPPPKRRPLPQPPVETPARAAAGQAVKDGGESARRRHEPAEVEIAPDDVNVEEPPPPPPRRQAQRPAARRNRRRSEQQANPFPAPLPR